MRRHFKIIIFSFGLLLFLALLLFGYHQLKKRMFFKPKPSQDYVIVSKVTDYTDKPHVIFVDFEDFELSRQITDSKSFSGQYSCYVAGKNSFSPVIKRPVKDMGLKMMTQAGLSAYVFADYKNIEQLQASLVLSIIDEKGNNIFWNSIGLNAPFFKAGDWTKISGLFNLADVKIKESHTVEVYLWNNSPTRLWIDDIFVVFGKNKPLKGDSVYCHAGPMGKALPSYNYPPFPYLYPEASSPTGSNLLNALLKVQANLHNASLKEVVATGNFINTDDGLDEIVFKSDGNLNILFYCNILSAFQLRSIKANVDIIASWDSSQKRAFKISKNGARYILLQDTLNQKMRLCYFRNTKLTTSNIPAELNSYTFDLKNFSHNNTLPLHIKPFGYRTLISIYHHGHIALFEYDRNGAWHKKNPEIASDIQNFISEHPNNLSFSKGHFLHNDPQKQLLIVGTEKLQPYMLLNVSPKSIAPAAKKSLTIGIDTLAPEHSYFSIPHRQRDLLLRYSCLPRFDMKLLNFNDSTYAYLYNINFSEKGQDVNPKFYEISAFLSGHFLSRNYTTIIAVCVNCHDTNHNSKYCINYKNIEDLPNTVFLYNFKNIPTTHAR